MRAHQVEAAEDARGGDGSVVLIVEESVRGIAQELRVLDDRVAVALGEALLVIAVLELAQLMA